MTDFLDRITNLSPKRLALLALELHDQVEGFKRGERHPIAIIGMGCRFPNGSDSPQALWQLLRAGRDGISAAPSDRWNLDRPLDALRDAAGQPRKPAGGFLERVDLFDPLFFGISPRETETMDPQQRLLLEVAWEALENAGLSAQEIQGSRTGVYLGIAGNDFLQRVLDQDHPLDGSVATGGSHAVAAGRLAYTLNLTGPCLSIDTACSSSLVAVSAACDSLRSGRSNMALAGGVSLILSPETTLILAQGGMLAADFRCKSFDAAADGFVRGEGCGMVVLKRLSDAERDGDRILAIIRGTAVNQDGRSSGLTAPSGPAQQALLREALADAGLTPAQVQYVEAHGTGTALGDPIEVQAIAAAFGQQRPADQPLWIGSIKTNFGHLEAAAGIAGLIKLVLALEHGEIPPLVHLKTPNPHVDWAAMPLALPTSLVPWPAERSARVGGVSSFGFSGTNAHLLVAAGPQPAPVHEVADRSQHLLCLSAKSDAALRVLAGRYADHLAEHDDAKLADVCYTANRGRAHHEHRLSVVGCTNQEIRQRLLTFGTQAQHAAIRKGKLERSQSTEVVFLFTGQGSQYAEMSRELYHTQPSFRATIDRCDAVLRGMWDRSLVDVLFSAQADKPALLDQTAFTQPALFAVEFALAELWQSWGIRPAAVLGHSVGEYVAACVAGVFSLEDSLKLIATRARLMQSLPPGGGMVAVLAAENDVVRAIAPFSKTLSIAAFNGPTNVVVSGPLSALDQFVARLETQGLPSQQLVVSHAFHSALLEPMLDEFQHAAEQVSYVQPQCTVISNLTGKPATDAELRSASYWRSHARQPVRFAAGIQALRGLGYKTFIEMGPAPVLSGMAKRIVTDPECRWLPTLRRGRSDWEPMLESLAELYVAGIPVDWAAFDQDYPRRKVSLPTYPFERSRYWPEIASRRDRDANAGPREDEAYRDWLYEPSWQPLADMAAQLAPPSYMPSPGALQRHTGAQAGALYQQLEPADDDDAYRQIDLLCRDYIIEALASLGGRLEAGQRFSADGLRRRLGVLDRHRRLFDRLLRILAEEGLLQGTSEEWIVVRTLAAASTQRGMQSLQAGHPQCAAELEVLESCGPHLADVLVGRCDPMQLLFPGGSLDLATRLYYETRPVALFNTLVERCLTDATAQLPADRSLRILEIGAGTGGTTARVLPHLPQDRTSYRFTDVSPQFLERARQRFAEYPFVEYGHFDLEHPSAEQGLAAGTFDVIIAANVIHATRDLRASLEQIKQLLKPEGLLVLLEVVRPQRLGDLTVGLTEGWWLFTDTKLRPDYALISEAQWLALLHEAGFADPVAVPGTAMEKTGLFANQSVLLAKKPAKPVSVSAPVSRQAPGRWLLWVDEQGVGQRLAEQLRQHGEECLLVSRGSRFESLGNGEFRIQPHSTSDHAEVVKAFRSHNPAQCRGAVYLWAVDASIQDGASLTDVQTAVEQGCHGALLATQAIVQSGGLADGVLTFVTRGGQSVEVRQEDPQPAQAALWGLANVVALEHPELHCRRIDLDPSQALNESDFIVNELLRGADAEDQIALRGSGSRFAMRLKRAAARDLSYPNRRLPADASYLVTGGLTGLGLETARWLVERGARYLVLVGRRAAEAQAQAAITAWTEAGAEVVCVQADIGDPADADRVFAAADALPVPLRGIVHSAGALEDAALFQQDWPRFSRVLKAKVDGAWNLHRRTLLRELDFFVLYSSGASLLGSVGQANHATANAFLDGLALYRTARGLPGLSINWGAWRETGAAVREDVLDRIERSGARAIDIRGGLKALECLLAAGGSRAAVLPIDWSKFAAGNGSPRGGALFAGLLADHDQQRAAGASSAHLARRWREKLESATADRRRVLLQELVGGEASAILRLRESDPIDSSQPLQELGLDSLMAVQLRNTLSELTGVIMPPTILYNCPTVGQLVDHLASGMTPGSGAGEDEADLSEQPSEMDLDALTEDDLVRILEQQIKLA